MEAGRRKGAYVVRTLGGLLRSPPAALQCGSGGDGYVALRRLALMRFGCELSGHQAQNTRRPDKRFPATLE